MHHHAALRQLETGVRNRALHPFARFANGRIAESDHREAREPGTDVSLHTDGNGIEHIEGESRGTGEHDIEGTDGLLPHLRRFAPTLRRIRTNSAQRGRNGRRGTYVRPMPIDQRPALATCGEILAAEHLSRMGYEIIERNARTRFGEIDLIVHGHDALVFVEVKTRRVGGSAGTPLEAINHRKVRQVRKLAATWLSEAPNRPSAGDIRFDAVGVTVDREGGLESLDHLEAAF